MKQNLFTRFFSWIWGNRKATEIVTEQAESVPESAESVPEPETAIAPASEGFKKNASTPARPLIAYGVKPSGNPFPLCFGSVSEASRKLHIDRSSISRRLNGKQKSAGGYRFELDTNAAAEGVGGQNL